MNGPPSTASRDGSPASGAGASNTTTTHGQHQPNGASESAQMSESSSRHAADSLVAPPPPSSPPKLKQKPANASPLSPASQPYPPPPSNAAIEQIIANAMALAGSGPSPSKGSSQNVLTSSSAASPFYPTPSPSGGLQPYSATHQQLPTSGLSSSMQYAKNNDNNTTSGIPTAHNGHLSGAGSQHLHPGMDHSYMHAHFPSGGGGRLGGTIGTFRRSHTPIMFHPAAVGVDGRVNLFVGNLPYRVRWQDVKDLFRRAGTVLRADVALDPQSNRSRGHGSVLMGSQEDGIKAIEMFNGYNWQTRVLEVRPDRLPPEYEPHPYVPPSSWGHMPFRMMPEASAPGMGVPSPAPLGAHGLSGLHAQHRMTPQMHSASPQLDLAQPRPVIPSNPDNLMRGGASGLESRLARENGDALSDAASGVYQQRTPVMSAAALNLNRGASPFTTSSRRNSAFISDDRSTTQSIPGSTPNRVHAVMNDGAFDGPFARKGSLGHMSHAGDPLGPSRFATDSRRGSHATLFDRESTSLDPVAMGSNHGAKPFHSYSNPDLLHRQDTVGRRLLHVSNLSFDVTWQELKDLFRSVGGPVLRADIAQGPDGRSKGHGNVLFQNEGDAAKAMRTLDG